jgi:diguanylate cyclase (GGDEF)-like protein
MRGDKVEVAAGVPRGRSGRASVAARSSKTSGSLLAGIPAAELTPQVRDALTRLSGEADHLRRELEDARAQIALLERLADEDALTPIANRRAFVRELTRMIAFSRRYGVPSSVVYFDVNGMKQINDTHGHPAGDAALRHVAKVLLENTRSSDIVGRLGGDEFGVILAHTNQDQANRKAAALAEAIETTPLLWGDTVIRVGVAFGVYSFSGTDDPQIAIEAADRAMYQHKRTAAG